MIAAQVDNESFLRRLAPRDFGTLPIYVGLTSAELPLDFATSHALAYTGSQLDLALKAWLASRNAWRGRGPAIVLDDEGVMHDVVLLAGDDLALQASLFNQRKTALLIHEAAHVLEKTIVICEPTDFETEFAQLATRSWCKAVTTTRRESVAPFVGHEARWVRNCLHLAYRAERIGEVVPLSLVMDCERYQISSPWKYRRALGDEPARLEQASFAEIRDTKPPNEFCQLWQNDVRQWFQEIKEPNDSCVAYVVYQLQSFN